MTSYINRRLYTPINVLRAWNPDYGRCAPDCLISRKPLRGFSSTRDQFWVSALMPHKYDEHTKRTLTVPGSTQTNAITIDLAAGGQIVKWQHTNVNGVRSLVNLFASQGRGMQSTLVIFEQSEPYTIQAIDVVSATEIRLTLASNHPFEPGKRVRCVVAGVVDDDDVPYAAINTTHVCHTAQTGSDYRNTVWLESPDATGEALPLAGGTLRFEIHHNPTQAGSAVGISPSAMTSETDFYQQSDYVFNQGSVLTRKPVYKLIGTNQGYIEVAVCPLDFNPSGEGSGNSGHEHTGGKYTPVLWTGLEIITRMWINFEGNEGVHKVTQTTVRDGDMLVGNNLSGYEWLSQNFDIHWNYNLGHTSGDPLAKAVTADAPEGTVSVFGGDYLNAVVWPGASGGFYFEPTVANNNLTLLPGYCVHEPEFETEDGADNPWNVYGGALVLVASDESVAAGFWKTTNDSPSYLASGQARGISGEGYGDESNGCIPSGVAQHIPADSGLNILKAGSTTITDWIVTGTPEALFDNNAAFFQAMLDNEYF